MFQEAPYWLGRMGGLRVVAKHLRSSQAVFVYVVCLYLVVMVHQVGWCG